MGEVIRYELITESDTEERVAVPWDEEVLSEIIEERGQMVYSVYSDSVKFAAEIDGEYVWQEYFYRGLISLYLYRVGDSICIKIVEENTVTSNPMISTFILTDGEYDMENIFNNVYVCRKESTHEQFGIGSVFSENSILYLVNNVDLGRSTAFKVEMIDLVVYK